MKAIWVKIDNGLVNIGRAESLRIRKFADVSGTEYKIEAHFIADVVPLITGTRQECEAVLETYGIVLGTLHPEEARQPSTTVPRCQATEGHVQCELPKGHEGEHCFIPF